MKYHPVYRLTPRLALSPIEIYSPWVTQSMAIARGSKL